MNKPLIITLNEVKMNLASVINNAMQQEGLPCYLIEPILSEMLSTIREGVRNEMQAAQEQMEKEQSDTGESE